MDRGLMRAMVRGAYDFQKIRIQIGQRIVANFKSKLGIEPGTKEKDNAQAKKILAQLNKDYKLITESIIDKRISRKKFAASGIINDFAEFLLVNQYMEIFPKEKKLFANVEAYVLEAPVYTGFMKGVLGLGPAVAGVILSEVDIEKATTVSKLYAYCGVDVAKDGFGRSRRKEHQIKREYTNKEGDICLKDSITFNPFLKTKLMGVLAANLLKAHGKSVKNGGEGSKYGHVYYDYRKRIDNHPNHKDKRPAHLNMMGLRYMVKILLLDLWLFWRELEGLEVTPPYHESKLGLLHGGQSVTKRAA